MRFKDMVGTWMATVALVFWSAALLHHGANYSIFLKSFLWGATAFCYVIAVWLIHKSPDEL